MAPKTTTAKKVAAHPSFVDMIKEAIVANKEDKRFGVSRTALKKFLASSYKLDMSSQANITHLAAAIKTGEEKGIFSLPKGASGKVKLASKEKEGKENVKPNPPAKATKAPTKKPIAKTAAKKPVVAKKAPAVKKPVASKKPVAKKAPAKPAAKSVVAKKPIAAKKAPAKKPVATKKAVPKKAAAAPVSVSKGPKKVSSTSKSGRPITVLKAAGAPARGAPKKRGPPPAPKKKVAKK